MLLQLLGVGVAAAITENIVFTRGLGQGFQHGEKSLAEQLIGGALVTLFSVMGSACGWLGRFLADNYFSSLLSWTRPALFVGLYSVTVVLLLVGVRAYTATCMDRPRQPASKLVYGFIPMGTLLLVGGSTFTFPEAVFYGAGAGVGYLLAILCNFCMQKRLTYSDIPVPFKGMPATLLTFGMISLALFGLLGHQLAV